jgi:hypothetical protein
VRRPSTPIIATVITPIVGIATESGECAASACAALAPGARPLITGPSSNGRKIEEGEQEQPADNRHMLQAGRQFVPELTFVAVPEAVPDHRRQNRKAGEQQRAQPCEESSGDEASADALGKDGGTREAAGHGSPSLLTSSMLERQFQSLSTAL